MRSCVADVEDTASTAIVIGLVRGVLPPLIVQTSHGATGDRQYLTVSHVALGGDHAPLDGGHLLITTPEPRPKTFEEVNAQYKVIKSLTETSEEKGCCNGGIHLVQHAKNGFVHVRKTLPSDMVATGYAKTECDILKSLRHRNVVRYISSVFCPETPRALLYTEWCDQGNLEDVICRYRRQQQFVPEAFIRHVFTSVANALAYIHYGIRDTSRLTTASRAADWQTILHRDLKPGNIFLSSTAISPDAAGIYPSVILGDFGLAIRQDSPRWMEPAYVGAPMLMPPEGSLLSTRSDIWALGVCIQQLCRLDDGPLVSFGRNSHGRVPSTKRGRHRHATWKPRSVGDHYSDALDLMLGQCQFIEAEERPGAVVLAIQLRLAWAKKRTEVKPLPRWALAKR
ncbi:MAG: hypothetical protein M1817_000461 [Caeruleum heppii]|nr:MAG: hypothetical protein M1817_000461 [Caeruleum heppii]